MSESEPKAEMVLVPRIPTDAMLDAALNDTDIYWGYAADGRPSGPEDVYRLMLAASPQATVLPAQEWLKGFPAQTLADIAGGLESGYPQSYDVGEECPRVESTTAYAARFIRAFLAARPQEQPKPNTEAAHQMAPVGSTLPPALSEDTRDAERLREKDWGMTKGVAMSLKPFLRPGEKVIWREPFRWKDEDGVLSNHYESMSLAALAADFNYEIVEDFKHAAIIRKLDAAIAAQAAQPKDAA